MKANKTNYLAPELEVIEISVECGFAASNDEYSDQLPEIDDEYNDIIKECKRKEKLALKKRYKELYTLLHETMVDPYDYVDLMIEYGQVGRKLKQLEQC